MPGIIQSYGESSYRVPGGLPFACKTCREFL